MRVVNISNDTTQLSDNIVKRKVYYVGIFRGVKHSLNIVIDQGTAALYSDVVICRAGIYGAFIVCLSKEQGTLSGFAVSCGS
ncbi:MAG: hypothetical protein ACJAUL_003934 [Paraglaciecola sp.]